ncbi:MAG: hypothetical protein AAF558_15705, partial [Verrucomicrobiota bacterium]
MKTTLSCILAALVSFSSSVLAATSLVLEANDNLSIVDSSGASLMSLPSGSIGKKITADNQAFKLSFGEDLNNRHTLIIYPDPSSPQSLDLVILGQPVTMSKDSVLTVTASQDGSAAQFQAGVLGQITVAGSTVAPGGSQSVQNGNVVASPPQTL